MRNLFIALTFMFIAVTSLPAQDIEAVASRIDLQRNEFPQEKIHVMTDRGNYLAGDTIWLRAWVVDAASHQQVDASQFVYIELVSPTDSVHSRIKIHPDANGVFRGYLPIEVGMPEGRYQLTAYTMFMQSVGVEYFYNQPIEIAALPSLRRRIISECTRYKDEVDVKLRYENTADGSLCPYNQFSYGTARDFWYEKQYNNRTREEHFTLKGKEAAVTALLVEFDNYAKYITLPPQEALDVSFYPEGGYLVPDVKNVMTFKVTNTTATTLSQTGELVDEMGNVIAQLQVEHDEMGIASFTPHSNCTYTARWKNNFDEYVTFPVPQVRQDATVLQLRRGDDGLITLSATGDRSSGGLIVLQQRGLMVASGTDTMTVHESDLPPGVIQAMLFDKEMHCLSERLFFVTNPSASVPQIATDHEAYTDRQPVKVTVDMSNLPCQAGNYAVSVIDRQACDPSEGNILTNLLLQSELRGRINQPNYYFELGDTINRKQRLRHLDMLMLTQGWRRYDIPRALRGRLAEPQFPIEVSQVVTGRVLSEWRKKPVPGAKVSLIAPRVEYSSMVFTDSLGQFAINMPLLPDSVDCVVMAENVKGKKQMNLELDQEWFPQTYYMTQERSSLAMASFSEDQDWRLEHSGDWRHIILNELMVKAYRPRHHSSERNPYNLTNKKIMDKEITTLDAVARNIPNLMVMDGALYTPGGRAIDHVTIYIDNEPISANFETDEKAAKLLSEYISPVEPQPSSSVFLGYHSSPEMSELSIAQSLISFKDVEYIYFVRGHHGGGSLYIEHREGYYSGDRKEPSLYLKITQPMGVQTPVEFYSPRYDQGDNGRGIGTDLREVLYWNPCVTINGGGSSSFDFYTSDAHNTIYLITIEGVAVDGTPFRTTHQVTKR